MFSVRFEVPYDVYPLEKGAFLAINDGKPRLCTLQTFKTHDEALYFALNAHNKELSKLFSFRSGHYASVVHFDSDSGKSTDLTRLIYDGRKKRFEPLLKREAVA